MSEPTEPTEPEEIVEVELNPTDEGYRAMAEDIKMSPVKDAKLNLTHDEGLRSTALLMAIRYYVDTIVKDGAMYTAMKLDGKKLSPACVEGVIYTAYEFEKYLRGESSIIAAVEWKLKEDRKRHESEDEAEAEGETDEGEAAAEAQPGESTADKGE